MTTIDLRPAHRTPATMTDYQRRMAAASAPQTKPCPRQSCPAGIGQDCRSTGEYTVPFHAARVALVADLTEDERVAATAAMWATEDRSHAAADAEMRRKEQDPAYVAQRDATRAYIGAELKRIREEGHAAERDFRARCIDTPFRRSRTHADACRCKTTGDIEYTPAFAEARRLRDLRGALPVTDLTAVRAVRRPTRKPVA